MIESVECGVAELASRHVVARALAAALADPWSALGRAPADLTDDTLSAAWRVLVAAAAGGPPEDAETGERSPAEVDFAPVLDWLRCDPAVRARVHVETFGFVISRACPQYETEYLPWQDATHRAQRLADIAGFYRAFGVEPSAADPQRPDHVALELEYAAFLLERLLALAFDGDAAPPLAVGLTRADCTAVVCDALAAFVADHVVWWMPTFGRRLEQRLEIVRGGLPAGPEHAAAAALAGVARVLSAWVAVERGLNHRAPTGRPVEPEVLPPETEAESCGPCNDCEGRAD